jgi:hypothetical protein
MTLHAARTVTDADDDAASRRKPRDCKDVLEVLDARYAARLARKEARLTPLTCVKGCGPKAGDAALGRGSVRSSRHHRRRCPDR